MNEQREPAVPNRPPSALSAILQGAWRMGVLVGCLFGLLSRLITIVTSDDWLSQTIGRHNATTVKVIGVGCAIGAVLGAVAEAALLVIRWAGKKAGR